MNPKVLKVLRWTGYALGYVIAFSMFTYCSFPYDRAKQKAIAGYDASQRGQGEAAARLEIEDLTWSWWFPGVVASGVRLIGPEPPQPAEGEKPLKREVMEVTELSARVALLPLLVGTRSVAFDAELQGGEVEGEFTDDGKNRSLVLTLEGVDPGAIPQLQQLVGLPLSGALSGTIELSVTDGEYSKAEGSLSLEFTDLSVGDGVAKIARTIALPRLQVGRLVLRATVEKGKLELEELSAEGADIEVVSEGKVRLRDKLSQSTLDLNLRFRFDDKYTTKNDMTRAIFGSPDSKAPGLIDLDPKAKRAKQDDGFYAWRVTGALANPSFQPDVSGSTSTGKGKGRSRLRGFAKKKDKEPAQPKATPPPAPPRPAPAPAPRPAPPVVVPPPQMPAIVPPRVDPPAAPAAQEAEEEEEEEEEEQEEEQEEEEEEEEEKASEESDQSGGGAGAGKGGAGGQ